MAYFSGPQLANAMANGQGYASTIGAPKVSMETIAHGRRGTEQTLNRMRDLALGPEGAHNPEVRFLAQDIVSDVPSKDYEGEARAIYEFMHGWRGNVRYTLDPRGLEWVQTPWVTLLQAGQGDCDDHATAACALAASLGHGCAFRTYSGDKSRPNDWSHVVAVILLRKNGQVRAYPIDSTEPKAQFGKDPPGARGIPQKTWVIVPA